MTTEFNLQITDIADALTVIDFFANQTSFKGWNNIRQILALRDNIEAMKAVDVLVEQTAFQNWNNARQIMALRDRFEAFVAAAAKMTAKTTPDVNNEAPVLPEAAAV